VLIQSVTAKKEVHAVVLPTRAQVQAGGIELLLQRIVLVTSLAADDGEFIFHLQ